MRAPRGYEETTSSANTLHLNVDQRTSVIEVDDFNISLIYLMRRALFLRFPVKVRFTTLNAP